MTLFKNKKIQDAFENSKSSLSSKKEKWNEISNDIKNFESYLRSLDLNQYFERQYVKNKKLYVLIFDGHRLLCDSKNDQLIPCKPLIEHNLSIRLDMYDFLPDFLLYINDVLIC